ARKYLGQSDGVLFSNNATYKKWQPDDKKLLSESVKILSGADLYLYNQIKDVQSQAREANAKLRALEREISQNKSIWQRIKRKIKGN
ncbi:MAG: hypothetical protein K6F00_09195, partial [Lachnospiraceae bacterium]|nr:hypothetical protein [Lachnospiraceae bacterium]